MRSGADTANPALLSMLFGFARPLIVTKCGQRKRSKPHVDVDWLVGAIPAPERVPEKGVKNEQTKTNKQNRLHSRPTTLGNPKI